MALSQIQVSGLTFAYEGSYDNIFEDVSFRLDTDWKLGFIGRNGKGKTTFLKLLMGEYEYQGKIQKSVEMEYFPYRELEKGGQEDTVELLEACRPDFELWKVCRELELLQADPEILYRPYSTLSFGERVKVQLALLFSEEGKFLLIDEPTNHLDVKGRETLCEYLRKKKGFLLVSHDRAVLDACVDHVLVLEREQIVVEQGNFSSWWENKQRRDQFEQAEYEKSKKEIRRLQDASRQAGNWADQAEKSKIGYDKRKANNYFIGTRAYIGEKSRKMQMRRKNLQRRQEKAIEEKEKLLKNVENPPALKLMPLNHYKEVYIQAQNLTLAYNETEVLRNFQMELRRGERVILQGKNGSGKSSLIRAILASEQTEVLNDFSGESRIFPGTATGELQIAGGLKISYISQDTSGLKGSLDSYINRLEVDGSLLKALLRQLDFERVQFEKNMEDYSEGQKKKVLIAGSLLQRAHLYLWDEPLNYIDIFSRMQIEELIRTFQPTMLMVEHDRYFAAQCGARIIRMEEVSDGKGKRDMQAERTEGAIP